MNNHFINKYKEYVSKKECKVCLGTGELMIDDTDMYGNIKNEKIAVMCTCQLEKNGNKYLLDSYSN